MSNESMFSEEEINLMKAGKSVSKSVSYGGNPKPESHQINVVNANTPSGGGWGKAPEVTHIGQRKVVRPRVKHADGTDNPQSAVYAPNLDRHNADDVARKAAKREAELERAEHLQLISPESLKNQLEAQNRIIKRLEKRLKSIEQTVKDTNDN